MIGAGMVGDRRKGNSRDEDFHIATNVRRLARTDGQESRRGAFAFPDDAHQFLVAQLFHTRSPVIQFGRLIGSHVDIDYFRDFRRFTWCDTARRYRSRDSGGNVSGIAGAIDRRQREPHGPIFARRVNSLKAQSERDGIAIHGKFDAFSRQLFRFTFQQRFGCHGGTVSRSQWSAARVAAPAFFKSATTLLLACIIR
jgi:hypothetical protein